MNTKSAPTLEQNASLPDLSSETTALLLGVAASLLLGLAIFIFGDGTTPPEKPSAFDKAIPAAPEITGKTAAELQHDLELLNREVQQAQAEREKILKEIEETSRQLNKKLKEADLNPAHQTPPKKHD